MTVDEQRTVAVTEARHWLGAMFHMNALLPYQAIDCGRLPWAVYSAVGITVPDLPSHWPKDFMFHRMAAGEPYLALIQQALVEVDAPLPGDLAVFKPLRSNCFSHAALVVEWPVVIHACAHVHRVIEGRADEWPLSGQPVRFFSPFGIK